ncbi:MAG: dihydroorotase [Firmicutes bacterium]|nr:dihydroorotase [Bacillota bacterium]
MRYCIKGGEIIDPAGNFTETGDLLLEDGKVLAVGRELPQENAQVIQAAGKIVCPGLIDLHSHLREPGREDEETIASGAKAALKGGFTAVLSMANTNPAADSPVVIEYVKRRAKESGYAKVYPAGAITKGLQGIELAEMGEMAAAGAIAFSDDGKTLMNPAVLRSALEYSKLFNLPLLLHEEENHLSGDGVMHEGYWSTVLGLPGIPTLAETTMIARDLLLAEETGAKVHFCHLSAMESVSLIEQAKKRGLSITAEAAPHHLALTDAALEGYDPVFRVSPPLRAGKDREALQRGLQSGVIDVVATDHAPHTLEEKHREFSLAPPGMIGFETALSVIWTVLVAPGVLTKTQLVERMAIRPAQILNVPGGRLRPGDPADVVVIDPNFEWEVKETDLISKSKNCPFIGWKLRGKVASVWVDGCLKYHQNEFQD